MILTLQKSLKFDIIYVNIEEKINYFKTLSADQHCLLIAVSKTVPVEIIKEAYDAGCRDFGEYKVQELLRKQPLLPQDIRWHMVGHLQSNKVKYIAPFINTIHSVDSLNLLTEINKQAYKHHRVVSCLLQIKIGEEETKFGMSYETAEKLLKSDEIKNLKNIKISGFMGLATNTTDERKLRSEFSGLRKFAEALRQDTLPDNVCPEELSMGMSSDFETALEEGSTMIRIGSLIFGARNYNKQ